MPLLKITVCMGLYRMEWYLFFGEDSEAMLEGVVLVFELEEFLLVATK